MPYELREGQGSLFKNDRKQKDSQPDRTGRALIGGVEYYVDGWIKKGSGSKGDWLSIAFKPVNSPNAVPPTRKGSVPAPSRAPAHADVDDDDSVPF